jgi:hypothetical protein
VTSGPEVLGDGAIRRGEALGVPWRREALHPPFSLARRLVGVLGAVVQVAMLPMLDTGQEVPLRRAVAFQLIGDEHPWYVGQALEQLPEELLGRMLIPPTLHQNIEHLAVLIHGPPEVMSLATDREEHLVEVPLVAGSGVPPSELVGIRLAKFPAPLAEALSTC